MSKTIIEAIIQYLPEVGYCFSSMELVVKPSLSSYLKEYAVISLISTI